MNHFSPRTWTLSLLLALSVSSGPVLAGTKEFTAPRTDSAPAVDGDPSDAAWSLGEWRVMDQLMAGTLPSAEDFSGRYKIVWTTGHIYLLAEITDDILMDSHPDPLENYWDDDALEFFIDEDASGGLHRDNYNAFAQHIALDNQSVDMGEYLSAEDEAAGRPNLRTFPEHVKAAWKRSLDAPHKIYWEVQISVYSDDFKDNYAPGQSPARPVTLAAGKVLGFMLAYCDADSPAGREHFMGDVAVEPVDGDRNRGYIDASVFGRLTLID